MESMTKDILVNYLLIKDSSPKSCQIYFLAMEYNLLLDLKEHDNLSQTDKILVRKRSIIESVNDKQRTSVKSNIPDIDQRETF